MILYINFNVCISTYKPTVSYRWQSWERNYNGLVGMHAHPSLQQWVAMDNVAFCVHFALSRIVLL